MRLIDYPRPGRALIDSDLVAGWSDGGQVQLPVSALSAHAQAGVIAAAQPSVDAAAGSSASASLSAGAAQAFVGGVLYASVAEGLAATAEGHFFTCRVAGSNSFAQLYQVVGGASVYQDSFVSKAAFEGAGGAGYIGHTPAFAAPGSIRSAGDLFDGRPDIIDIIGGAEATAIRQMTSAYDASDTLTNVLGDFAQYQKFGKLWMSGGRLRLDKQVTIDAKQVQLDFAGEIDHRNLPDNSVGFEIHSSASEDLDGRGSRHAVLSGLNLIGPGGALGPNWGRGCTGIKYVDCANLIVQGGGLRDYAVGITNGDHAHNISHLAMNITVCGTGYLGAEAADAGERIVFAYGVFAGCATAVVQNAGFGELLVRSCSFDYPSNVLSADTTDANVRFAAALAGLLDMDGCHFEGGGPLNPMGGLAPFYQGPDDSSSLRIGGGTILFAAPITTVPIFQNDNPNRDIDLRVRPFMFNGFGTGGVSGGVVDATTSIIAQGRISGGFRTTRGAAAPTFGPSSIGAILSREENRVAGLGQVAIFADTAPITSAKTGANIMIALTGNSSPAGVPEFSVHKVGGAGSEASFCLVIPIGSNQLAGGEMSFAKAGTMTGSMQVLSYYVAAHRESANGLVVDQQYGGFSPTVMIDTGSLTAAPERYAFGGLGARAPAGATHAIIVGRLFDAGGSGSADDKIIVSGACMGEIE